MKNYIEQSLLLLLTVAGSRLVPDRGTKFGQDVDRYRKLINDVRVDVITYGVILNRSLSLSGIKLPPAMAKGFTNQNIGTLWYFMLDKISANDVLKYVFLPFPDNRP